MASLLLPIAAATLALVQTAPPQTIDTRRLQRLDEHFQDVGPLRTSLFSQAVDLRQPTGFDDVYRLPGGGPTERLARINGGLAAVFPRSTYLVSRKGSLALVPPGTVFYIGSIPTEGVPEAKQSPVAAELTAETRTSTRRTTEQVSAVDTRVGDPQVQSVQRDTASRSSIMSDEGYRAARVRELLQIAATSSQASR